LNDRAAKLLAEYGFNLDPRARTGRLSAADRQLVEITRAVVEARRVIVMDEPTSSLTNSEVSELFRIIRDLKARGLAIIYIELIRGTPLLVQIFIFYFFIGTVLNLDRTVAGVGALALFVGAYIAEIIRAGIQSIAKGQTEAARSLGMTAAETMLHIVLPQALKRVLPPLAGQFISLIKDSSLVSVIAITDLTKSGREIITSSFATFEIWFTVALLYLVVTSVLSQLLFWLERRFARSD